ncbi:MAG: type CRISPR-associated protein Cas6/Cse3/CasE [Ramlibacter sp.]|jgi:CRISPR system Cascade subunit CasE|uniref:type I-E CRISPR-associated protein Cas6/Cse3/CasE n=1 Tax=Ramlibacter sp. TaxID=1917967 RepID=UPI00262340B9|nr:type I-E CRISPR-associated protein Cas6/Cse3/CasE [Ramlibacter sp.]MDB5751820.1 type CRISPR-associated protein Cas6/Cse3/CasE [Ramlibacter sp.]
MYFSLITPAEGRERDAVHERLDGPYADHQWLWRWFPTDQGAPRDFLFRQREADGIPRYHVVSRRAPVDQMGAWRAQIRSYAPSLQEGDRLHFELRANPTVRHGRDGKSKRHDVVMEAKKKMLAERGFSRWADWTGDDKPSLQTLQHAACSSWLQRRGTALGFSLEADTLMVDGYVQHQEKPDRALCFSTVELSGQMTVTEPQAFQAALVGGIGSAKAFGCGLLLVRRMDA